MAMNMRKWGSFAGGLSSGLSGGMKLGDQLATSKVDRAGKQQDIDYKKRQRDLTSKGYKNLFGLMTGAMTPEQFYKQQALDYGFDTSDVATPPFFPEGAVPTMPQAAAPDAGGYTGPGLAEY